MKMKYSYAVIVLIGLTLGGCSFFNTYMKQFIGEDPAPPEGYSPIFISTSKPINPNEDAKRTLQLSRTEPYKSDKVRLYLHLIQSDTIFLTEAASNQNKQFWCEVIDEANGETHRITDFTIRQSTKADRTPRAIAMVMDLSGSMGDMRAKAVQTAVYNFLMNTKAPDDEIALIMYDDNVGIECQLTSNRQTLLNNLKRDGLGNYGKGTATLDAIDAGIEQVKKSSAGLERVVMVFTDGQDNASKKTKSQIIDKARATNTVICAIDYGYMIQTQFLEDIANKTNGTYNHIYLAHEFDLVFKDIYHRLQDFYILEYEPPTFGEHKVTVKLCMPSETLAVEGTYNNAPYAGMAKMIDVYFDTGKSILKPESEKAINIVYKMLKSKPSMRIELQGHTDSKGDPVKNQKLSEDRANAVRDALIKKGIDPSRLSAVGYGQTQPIADNNTPEGRAKNRRTVFIVLSE